MGMTLEDVLRQYTVVEIVEDTCVDANRSGSYSNVHYLSPDVSIYHFSMVKYRDSQTLARDIERMSEKDPAKLRSLEQLRKTNQIPKEMRIDLRRNL
jgi:hypothetical protein